MDPDEARRRLDSGGVWLCLDVPQGTELQCDMAPLVVGPRFRGIKMIPPGLHMFCWSAGHDKHATFFLFEPAQVEPWRWQPDMEDLCEVKDPEQAARLSLAVRNYEFDSQLGAYPEERRQHWERLSYLITPSTLSRCAIPLKSVTSAAAQEGNAAFENAPLPPSLGDFAALPRRTSEMRPEEVTQNNMDGSARALQILGARFAGAWSELLAELQLSFLLFLLLASLPGLEEWKAGVCLLCSCGELMRSQPDNMAEFVRVLRRQLEQVPEDFFRDELSASNFLGPAITWLLQEALPSSSSDAPPSSSSSSPGQRLLQKRVARLREVMMQRFGLDMDPREPIMGFCPEDDAPVVVPSAAARPSRQEEEEEMADAETRGGGGAGGDSGAGGARWKDEGEGVSAVSRMDWMLPPPGMLCEGGG